MFDENQKRLLDKLERINDFDVHIAGLIGKAEKTLEQIRGCSGSASTYLEKEARNLNTLRSDIEGFLSERTQGFPTIADAAAQYFYHRDLKVSEYLKRKKRPAKAAAEQVKEIAAKRRMAEKKFRVTRNLIKMYEVLCPWLEDYVGEDVDDLLLKVGEKEKKVEHDEDPIKEYLVRGEYETLSPTERNQRALDNYWRRPKRSWMIGRDYERYIGYLYEKDGYAVYYQGIEAGLEDLGRDLIATKEGEAKVIQCKYWAQYKTIHEKHICQLFGTTLKYGLENRKPTARQKGNAMLSVLTDGNIVGVFATSTKLSDTAREFADQLGIQVREHLPLEKYPSIKCNVSKVSREKIYHLPMDQQYDKTIIGDEEGECYVETVAEAESLGFRRAWRWRGNK